MRKIDRTHRRICKTKNGYFPPMWHVHHIDGNHSNNDPTNLIAIPPYLHASIHKANRSHLQPLPSRADIEKMLVHHQTTIESYEKINSDLSRARRWVRDLEQKKEALRKRLNMRMIR